MASSSGVMPGSPGVMPVAVLVSDNHECKDVKDLLNQEQGLITPWIDALETPLKKACSCCQLEIVKKLLLHEMMTTTTINFKYRKSLELDIAAADGNLEKVERLCTDNHVLLMQDSDVVARLVVRASNAGHEDVTRYLYENHYRNVLRQTQGDIYWAQCLLLDAIFYGFLDIALDILTLFTGKNAPTYLALAEPCSQRSSPLRVLAMKSDLFRSHCDLRFLQRLIYSCLSCNTREGFPKWFPKWFGIKHIYELKYRHCKSYSLLKKMCQGLPEIMAGENEDWKETVHDALLQAVENGNKEFFIEIINCNSNLLWISEATSGQNLFQLAVKFKKEKIFNLIYGLDDRKVTLLRSSDIENNNILHIVAHLSTLHHLSKISGAALKIQRECQWYEEVKSLVSPREVMQKNKDNKTPRQVFEQSHEPLRKEGEEWMKYTATACSFVAALIATVTFQAIFTVPGGTDETLGKPILLRDFHFTAFILADTISFFTSCLSVLIFLSILTSRYSFDDFIVSLPRKMIFGLSFLFISIAAMLVAFITSLSASMRQRPTLVVPLKPLASFPALLFLMLQYPLLKEMLSSTYGKGLFRRDTKSWLKTASTA